MWALAHLFARPHKEVGCYSTTVVHCGDHWGRTVQHYTQLLVTCTGPYSHQLWHFKDTQKNTTG